MKNIFLNNVFDLEIKSSKSELQPHEIIEIIKMKQNPEIWGFDLILELCSPMMKMKLRVWKWYHNQIENRFNQTWIGKCRIWIMAYFFQQDVTEIIITPEMYQQEAQILTDFLNDKTPTYLPPLPKLGHFQDLHQKAFKNMTVHQFIEAHRCAMMLDQLPTDALKEDALNELIAYSYLPNIAWKIPFVGEIVREYFLQDKFLKIRKNKVSTLDYITRVLLFDYYNDNMQYLQKLYKEFYSGGKSEEKTDIRVQYFSMKNLVQLRSPNLIASRKVLMMQITELIDSYETEMVVAEEKLKAIKALK